MGGRHHSWWCELDCRSDKLVASTICGSGWVFLQVGWWEGEEGGGRRGQWLGVGMGCGW